MAKPFKIAFYLPQFYPTAENDLWWGKGFTEWTNVGKAKPLFKGHSQPRVPADLGYYDLRVPDTRAQQAEMAQKAGIDGFCYWHYWFNGRRLLNHVFDEVVASGRPQFPFCLCWANHSWKAKTWSKDVPDRLLIEQTYGGTEDYVAQFYAMLPAFRDERYIKVGGKLLYGIFEPDSIPDMELFARCWNDLAASHQLPGFTFFGLAQGSGSLVAARKPGLDMIVYDAMYDAVYIHLRGFRHRIKAKICGWTNRPYPLEYDQYCDIAIRKFNDFPETVPCIIPNFDHSPRSGGKGVIITGNTPEKWANLCRRVLKTRNVEEKCLLFIKSWNEWGEGNYLEPDLEFGDGYIKASADAFSENGF